MITYLMMARKKESKNQEKSSTTQDKLMTVKPASITEQDELMTIEAELITNEDELIGIEPESRTTPKELAMIPPKSTLIRKELVMTRPISKTSQQELIKMNEQSGIMTSKELQDKAGTVGYKDRLTKTTYAKIVERLEQYEAIQNSDAVTVIVSLMRVIDKISTWLNLNDNNPKKEQRKKVLKELQKQIADYLPTLVTTEEARERLDPELAQLLVQGEYYAKSPTILFTYLMEKIISIYRVGEITKQNFKTEMRNFLIADNDLIGATSLASQSSGGSGGVKIGFDAGSFILPCFKLAVDIDIKAKVAATRLIISECQSELENTKNLSRYCLMNMNGRGMEGKIKGTLTVAFDPILDFEGQNVEILETASLNCVPTLKAYVSGAADVKGVFLQVIEPSPRYFNLFEEVDKVIFDLVTSKNQSVKVKMPSEPVFFSLTSNAYGGEVEAGAKGQIGVEVNLGGEEQQFSSGAMAKAELKAGVYGSAKFSNYTYQNRLSNGIFKTQRTKMFLKQVSAAAEASASVEVAQDPYLDQSKRGQYDLINSLSYSSGFLYWDKKTAKLSKDGLSGFAHGHSLIAQQLTYNYYLGTPEQKSRYTQSLATQLKPVDQKTIENFLNNHKDLILDILKVQKEGHFLEATFVAPENLDFLLDAQFGLPDNDTFERLEKQSTKLQSLRFRTALEDGDNITKPGFKFGLNLKVVKLGIDLGKVEEASSLKFTDYAIEWYDQQGAPSQSQPNQYVPSSFLFL